MSSRVKERLLLWQTSQVLKSNGGLPEGRSEVRTYSDYLRAAQEAEKEDSMELPRGPRAQTTNKASKP